MNIKLACTIHEKHIKLGHPQPPKVTPLYTNKSIANGIITSYMRQKLFKAFKIYFYWVRDCIKQKKFDLIWRRGKTKKAD